MPALKIGGQEFACIPELGTWQLMDLAEASQSGELFTVLAGYRRFLRSVLEPKERSRFERFMNDYRGDDIDEAIGELIKAYTGRPTERPSSSQDGPQVTGGTSRVVSLKPATDVTDGTSSTAGQSAAS